MMSTAQFPAGWQRFFQRAQRVARKLAAITSKVRPMAVSLESLQWASVEDSRLTPAEGPGVKWRDLTALADEFAAPELLMAAGVSVNFRLNLPTGAEFHAHCHLTAGTGKFALAVRPLESAGTEVRCEWTLTPGTRPANVGLTRAKLRPLNGLRVELTLGVESVSDTETAGVWLDPQLTYSTPRASFSKRLRAYLSAGGLKRLRTTLSQTLNEGRHAGRGLPTGSRSPEVADATASVSILLATEDRPEQLRSAVESVLAQSSPRWDLLVVPGAATPPEASRWVEERAAEDPRIRLLPAHGPNGERALSLAAGLQAAEGVFVATLREGDALAKGAVERVLAAAALHPEAAWLYTDEDLINDHGRRLETRHKPDWGRDSMSAGLLPGRWCVCRRGPAQAVGGYRPGTAGAEEYDLALRLVEAGHPPTHLPVVLHHTRVLAGDSRGPAAERAAADAFLARTRPGAHAVDGSDAPYFRPRFPIAGTPLVSIILPTNGVRRVIDGREIDLLATCVRSIVEKTDYPHYEVLCVDNANLQPETLSALDALRDARVRVISFTAPFNLADKFNWAAGHTKGEHLLLLNDDTEVITAEWLSAMLEFSQQDRVGAVGAKLFFPSGQLQHAGVPLYRGLPGHRAYGLPDDLEKATPELRCVRNFSAVTGACVMTRRKLWDRVGGFNRDFPLNYNDVDYCLKVQAAGHDVVFTPFAQLWHYESLSREKGVALDEVERMRALWNLRVQDDPDAQPAIWARGKSFNWLPD